MSRDLSASRLVVDETQRRISDAGIGFSIHTTHTTPEGATTVAGTHVVPFGEPYAITLMVVARVTGETPTEVETRRRLLESLRVKARTTLAKWVVGGPQRALRNARSKPGSARTTVSRSTVREMRMWPGMPNPEPGTVSTPSSASRRTKATSSAMGVRGNT